MNERLDTIFDGMALIDRGLYSSYNTVSGIGLLTEGFIWSAEDIWAIEVPNVSTTWTIEPN